MITSGAGVALIKSYEKLVLHAYLPTPNDRPTIGYGHTRDVKMGDTCTEAEAVEFLRQDLHDAEGCINYHVQPELEQHQFDALVSLVFNIGCGAFKISTILALINAKRFDAAALQFPRWNKQNGKVLNGLTRRRMAEKYMFEGK